MFTKFFRRTSKPPVEVLFDVVARPTNKETPVVVLLREKLHAASCNTIELTADDARKLRREIHVALAPFEGDVNTLAGVLRTLIKELEAAVHAHAYKGAQPPEDWEAIEEDLRVARHKIETRLREMERATKTMAA